MNLLNRNWNKLLLPPVWALAILLGAFDGGAATLVVTNAADSGADTLRADIALAAPGDTITFAPGLGAITLTTVELLINKNLTLVGPGGTNQIVQRSSAAPPFRIFNVLAGTVALHNLAIKNGLYADDGGGICNQGTLTISNCTISGNSAGAVQGGGIFSFTSVTIYNSTIVSNSASVGGGIVVNFGSTASIVNSTIVGNVASSSVGGGIYNVGALTVSNCTVCANVSGSQGSGIYSTQPAVLFSSIIASNTINSLVSSNRDFSGIVASAGYNLVGGTDVANGWLSTDQRGTIFSPLDAGVGPLQDNGGPTLTMALQPGSLALDQGQSGAVTTDQRGRHRTYDDPAIPNPAGGDGADVGAYEFALPIHLVTNTNDSGLGSLRQAILDSVTNDTVIFDTSVSGTILLSSGELVIGQNLKITGPTNTAVIVSGINSGRVLHVTGGTASVSRLTFANGNTNAPGAGIFNEAGCTLLLNSCTVSGNVSGNNGGGLANNGTVAATNCTFSGNQAASGGGLYNSGGSLVLSSCTVASNSASIGGGVYHFPVAGTTTTLNNSLVAGNSTSTSGPDVLNTFTNSSYNLIGKTNGSTGLNGSSNIVGSIAAPINPLLGPLQYNGGLTFTHALHAGSPALDRGKNFGVTLDQRGRPRPFDFSSITNAVGGDASDIGAFELNPPRLSIARIVNDIVLSWSPDPGYTLESTIGSLRPTNNWTTVPVAAGQYAVTNKLINTNVFFRLNGP